MINAMHGLLRQGRFFAALIAVLGICMSAAWADPVPARPIPTIPYKATSAADDSLVYRAAGAFLLAGAAAYGLSWCIKRYMPGLGKGVGRESTLERLETMRLGARSVLVRVRWGDEELLLGENEHGVALIARRPRGADKAAGERHE